MTGEMSAFRGEGAGALASLWCAVDGAGVSAALSTPVDKLWPRRFDNRDRPNCSNAGVGIHVGISVSASFCGAAVGNASLGQLLTKNESSTIFHTPFIERIASTFSGKTATKKLHGFGYQLHAVLP